MQQVVNIAQMVFYKDLHRICTKEKHAQEILDARLSARGFRVLREGDIHDDHAEFGRSLRGRFDLLVNEQVKYFLRGLITHRTCAQKKSFVMLQHIHCSPVCFECVLLHAGNPGTQKCKFSEHAAT